MNYQSTHIDISNVFLLSVVAFFWLQDDNHDFTLLCILYYGSTINIRKWIRVARFYKFIMFARHGNCFNYLALEPRNLVTPLYRIHINVVIVSFPCKMTAITQNECVTIALTPVSPQYTYTECPRRNGQNFGRVFLMLNYTDITQNTYIQSWTVTEIMAREVWNFDSCYTLIDYQIHISP